MPIADEGSWSAELIEAGRIVQDGDKAVSPQVAEQRFKRYAELVEMVEGTEGIGAARALLRSMRVRHDYGGYQPTMNKLFAFPPKQAAEALIHELPRLISELPDWAGDLV